MNAPRLLEDERRRQFTVDGHGFKRGYKPPPNERQ